MTYYIISILLIASLVVPASAQGQYLRNQFELSLDPISGPWTCLWHSGLTTLYLYVHYPHNPSFDGGGGQNVIHISGFECRIEALGDVVILGLRYPVPSINAGTGSSYVVGYSEPVHVNNVSFILAEVDILIAPGLGDTKSSNTAAAASPVGCHDYSGRLFIAPTYRPSVPGMMAYLDADDPDDPLVGATRYGEDPDADVRTEPRPVAEESRNWGSIKALYR
jgi:hypothetical protein